MSERLYNFNPGPAVLPVEALTEMRDNLLNYQGSGMGVMELSHRGSHFKAIIEEAESLLRSLLGAGDEFAVLFTTGGASNQFSMVPMNLAGPKKTASYIVTGSWSKKAVAEAKKHCEVHIAATSEDDNFSYIPNSCECAEENAYCHFTSNNTIFGTQFQQEPDCSTLLACDASSDFLSRPIALERYGVVYAGAQKNLGPAGVTVVVVRRDLLGDAPDNLPVMLRYATYADSGSLYNTPPAFAIYGVKEVLSWLTRQGGLSAIDELNQRKAKLLYDTIDGTDFYRGHAKRDGRSLMNVTFRIASHDLEPVFLEEATEAGLLGLKGHRSVGGLRASLYNAFPLEGVEQLVQFMRDFEQRKG